MFMVLILISGALPHFLFDDPSPKKFSRIRGWKTFSALIWVNHFSVVVENMERITWKKDLNSKWRFNLLYLHLVHFYGTHYSKKDINSKWIWAKLVQNWAIFGWKVTKWRFNKLNLHLEFKFFFSVMRSIRKWSLLFIIC